MSGENLLNGRVVLHHGDSRDVLRSIPDASIDSVVTDPPYALVSIVKRFGKTGAAPARHGVDGLYARASSGFMGQAWDTGETAFAVEFWAEVLRVLKPGGHVMAFSGTRTYHRMAVAIEDAGFEIRDQFAWAYGSGFPKSHGIAKAIDDRLGWFDDDERAAGMCSHTAAYAEPLGTAVKPAWEPICCARKPLIGTLEANFAAFGTGMLNIDGCRIETSDSVVTFDRVAGDRSRDQYRLGTGENRSMVDRGRWPANIIHDGSPEVLAAFPVTSSGVLRAGTIRNVANVVYGKGMAAAGRAATDHDTGGDAGSAARFFYSAKADGHDRVGSRHPTVKPVDLMQWLCRLVTPPGGSVLDPFAGSGTTGEAAWREGFRAVLIEREATYCDDIRRRMRLAERPAERAAVVKSKGVVAADHGPLFGGVAL